MGDTSAKEKGKYEALEERLRIVEGEHDSSLSNIVNLRLMNDVVIPHKFKVPEFEKYRGTTCPKSHVKMYCQKMEAYAAYEKLMMHFFQDSLTGAAADWYAHLEPSRIHTWRDLVEAFVK